MRKLVLATALVSVVSGCVTSEGPVAQKSAAIRAAGTQQAQRYPNHAPKLQQTATVPIIIGAAY